MAEQTLAIFTAVKLETTAIAPGAGIPCGNALALRVSSIGLRLSDRHTDGGHPGQGDCPPTGRGRRCVILAGFGGALDPSLEGRRRGARLAVGEIAEGHPPGRFAWEDPRAKWDRHDGEQKGGTVCGDGAAAVEMEGESYGEWLAGPAIPSSAFGRSRTRRTKSSIPRCWLWSTTSAGRGRSRWRGYLVTASEPHRLPPAARCGGPIGGTTAWRSGCIARAERRVETTACVALSRCDGLMRATTCRETASASPARRARGPAGRRRDAARSRSILPARRSGVGMLSSQRRRGALAPAGRLEHRVDPPRRRVGLGGRTVQFTGAGRQARQGGLGRVGRLDPRRGGRRKQHAGAGRSGVRSIASGGRSAVGRIRASGCGLTGSARRLGRHDDRRQPRAHDGIAAITSRLAAPHAISSDGRATAAPAPTSDSRSASHCRGSSATGAGARAAPPPAASPTTPAPPPANPEVGTAAGVTPPRQRPAHRSREKMFGMGSMTIVPPTSFAPRS